ncbi:MAG: type II toxin-antitoxin system VapC family toxin [Candidatus Diapherotrites archaeon]
MGKRFYLDSNVLIAFVREEMDSSFNLHRIDREHFFALCRKQKHEFILPPLFFTEVRKVISLERETVLEEFERLQLKVAVAEKGPSKKLVSEIARKSGIHLADATHAAFACENQADAIISWNKKDFIKTEMFVKCFTPLEILDKP